LAVLPGTGGLTRVTDKRKVRRDLADVFCSIEEGVKGKRAQEWRLVDEVVPNSKFEETVAARARAFAAKAKAPVDAKGISLTPLRRAFGEDGAAPLVAVGLDVTRKVQLLPEHLSALAGRIGEAPRASALMRFLEDATRHYFEFIEKREGRRFFTMHDPLALAAALDPSLIETQRVAVDVETAGALTAGMTVADWRGVWKRKPGADVAIGVRAEAMIVQFLDRMEWLARQP